MPHSFTFLLAFSSTQMPNSLLGAVTGKDNLVLGVFGSEANGNTGVGIF